MQYNANNPEEYLKSLDEDWRKEKVLEIRKQILSEDTDLQEKIEYKMLAYTYDEKTLFHLNAQKNYVSLYVGNISKVPHAETYLKDFDKGKGCIRIKKNTILSETSLDKFIKTAVDVMKNGADLSC